MTVAMIQSNPSVDGPGYGLWVKGYEGFMGLERFGKNGPENLGQNEEYYKNILRLF